MDMDRDSVLHYRDVKERNMISGKGINIKIEPKD